MDRHKPTEIRTAPAIFPAIFHAIPTQPTMSSRAGIVRRQNTSLGRSGPRSKNGCQTCRLRRVRCDEKRPMCGHCDRLKLVCNYQQGQIRPRRRQRQLEQGSAHGDDQDIQSLSDQEDRGSNEGCIVARTFNDTATANSHVDYDPAFQPADQGEETRADSMVGSNNQQLDQDHSMDALDIMAPNNEAYGADESTVIPDFIIGTQDQSDWQFDAFNDYVPLADPVFSFTSLGFTNSARLFDTDHASIIQPLTTPDSADNGESLDSAYVGSHSAEDSQDQRHTRRQPQSTLREANDAPTTRFAISPPILSTTQEHQLLKLFETEIQPPASIVGVDPLGWRKIRRYMLKMADGENDHVMLALFAISTLLSSSKAALQRTGINQDNYKLTASRLHDAACASMKAALACGPRDGQNSRSLLVSLFLLAWFEIAYDGDNQASPIFPKVMAEKIISALQVVHKSQSSLGSGETMNENAHGTSSTAGLLAKQPVHSLMPSSKDNKKKKGDRLEYLLSSSANVSLSRNIIRLDVLNILLCPAFEFHIVSQAYSRRIGSYDRHHRPRGTPEDEREVMDACMAFEEELQELWQRRPGILNLNAAQLGQFVARDIANRLEQLFSIYIATFWNHYVYIHRVAFWTLKHTPIMQKALQQSGNMMRRSISQPIDQHAFDPTIQRTPANSIHPGLMWVCFLFGCEVEDPIQQEWAVLQLRALGELSATPGDEREPSASEDELLAFRLDEKGSQTALRVSQLLSVLVERQRALGARVDGKYLCKELFGCHFYII
ncbi:C6 finger domain-containing protein [Fusarium mexicanum]|uniref:C6 finger domain-containing protein n=1 Tax=Fusarium mexicanum TaxID=751941 RepID=A0A8H5IIT4_9HYPO|nr:C6 finger domain-containing protein [Fusarium mexicanum]